MQAVRVVVFVTLVMALLPFGVVRAQEQTRLVPLAPSESLRAQEPDACLGESPDTWRQQQTELEGEIERLESSPQAPDTVIVRYGISKTKADWLQTFRNLLALTAGCAGTEPEAAAKPVQNAPAQTQGAGPLEFVEYEDGVCVLRAPFVCIDLDGRTYTRPDAAGERAAAEDNVADQQPAEGETEEQAGAEPRFRGEWTGTYAGSVTVDGCTTRQTGNVTLRLQQDVDGGPVVGSVTDSHTTAARDDCRGFRLRGDTDKCEMDVPRTRPIGDKLTFRTTCRSLSVTVDMTLSSASAATVSRVVRAQGVAWDTSFKVGRR